jgi:cobalt-precorrin-7 (C5)-methyltransferase
VISVGPGDHDMITVKGLKAIEAQDFIIGMTDAIETFALHKPHYIPQNMRSDSINYIKNSPYKKIGVLVSGDAGFFSLARFITKEFENVQVIAGVSSMCAGFALLKKMWFSYRFMSVHGRELFDDCPEESTVILCDEVNSPDAIIKKFPQITEKFNFYILCDISLPTEAVYTKLMGQYGTSRIILVLEEKTA